MDIGHIKGATRILGAPKDWDHERRGICEGLPILDHPEGWQISEWRPTAEELWKLTAGGSVRLWIMGPHPVVALDVMDSASSSVAKLEKALADEREKVRLLRHALGRLNSTSTALGNICQIALGATE